MEDGVAQLRATEMERPGTFVVDMTCQGMSDILEEVKETPWPLVGKRTIPTERPPLVDVNLSFLDRSL
jgi:hypothetical protein